MLEALKRSGYFLESRVLEVLAKNNYKNFPNQTYPDSITGKSREIDIISQGERLTKTVKLNFYLTIEFQHDLVIECINNSQPIAFFKRPDKSPYTIFGKFVHYKTDIETSKLNEYDSFHTFHDHTTTSKDFHYNLLNKNTQYCSFSPKKNNSKEWMASHPDALYDTFNKLHDYCEHSIKETEDWIKGSYLKNEDYNKFIFPVIILQNDLIEISEINDEIKIEKKNHIIFEFSKYSEKRTSLLIDVITEDYLPEYIKLIEKDLLKIQTKILKTDAINKIVK